MYLREIEMISLYIHDCMPHNYAEPGIWAGDASLSKYYNFFSPYDPLPIARKNGKILLVMTTYIFGIVSFQMILKV